MTQSVEFAGRDGNLILTYHPGEGGAGWIPDRLNDNSDVVLMRVFHFVRADLVTSVESLAQAIEDDQYTPIEFAMGRRRNGYYEIEGRILGIDAPVFIEADFALEQRHFVAPRKVSVFKLISKLTKAIIRIGSAVDGELPAAEFERLVRQLPTERELQLYVEARSTTVLREYLDKTKDSLVAFEKYRNKRGGKPTRGLLRSFKPYEAGKFEAIHRRLTSMLEDEDSYTEKSWQQGIADILLLVYPKYVLALREAPIIDMARGSSGYVDFLLVDHRGFVDVLEIKRPGTVSVLTGGVYRGSHIPRRELSGCIVQVEKYIYNLVRSGKQGEERLRQHYRESVPDGLELKVASPSGLVLVGRDAMIEDGQRVDFEIVRRHYRNVMDIVTYDDLLCRIATTLSVMRGGIR